MIVSLTSILGQQLTTHQSAQLAHKLGLPPGTEIQSVKKHHTWLPELADAPLESYKLKIKVNNDKRLGQEPRSRLS